MRKDKKITTMLLLVAIVMGLTVGYAVLSTNLNINGSSTISNARWDIHFENIQTVSGSVTPSSAATINAAGNTITYAVTLAKPGDFYEFTVDVRNGGTIDGMIESVTSKINNQPISNKPVYLDYYVTYNDGIEIENNQLLTAGTSEKIKVHVGFSTDISADDLPGTSQTYSLSLNIKETQATSAAEARPYYVYAYGIYAIDMDINEPINGIHFYNNYNEVTNIAQNPFFMKILINNNIITDIDFGYVYNNQDHYLEAFPRTEADYNANVSRVVNVLGNSCEPENNYYMCTMGNSILYVGQSSVGIVHNDMSAGECVTLAEGGYCTINFTE